MAPESSVETYAALRLAIETWRWEGVPFSIRAGKRLPQTVAEVRITLRRPPYDVFGEGGAGTPTTSASASSPR